MLFSLGIWILVKMNNKGHRTDYTIIEHDLFQRFPHKTSRLINVIETEELFSNILSIKLDNVVLTVPLEGVI